MRKLLVWAFAWVVILGMGGVSARSAEPTPEQINTVTRVEVTVETEDPMGVEPLAKGDCVRHFRGYHVDGYNAIGTHLWRFGASGHSCTKGGKVVRMDWDPCYGWTNSFPVLWNFKECHLEDQSGQALPRRYVWRQWRSTFGYCVTWICKTIHPWVYIGARGDGTWGQNGGPN